MDEAEWLASEDPAAMLEFVRNPAHPNIAGQPYVSDRKLRLFACACRRAARSDYQWPADGWGGMEEHPEREVINSGNPSRTIPAIEHARLFISHDLGPADKPPARVAAALLRDIVGNPFRPVLSPYVTRADLDASFVPLTRRVVAFQAGWLDPTVLGIASEIYESRAFEDLPILADALEDAGCEEMSILAHLRSDSACDENWQPHHGIPELDRHPPHCKCKGTGRIPAVHVRGCWVLDLILGKE